jgi:hypothetical protein
MGRRAWIVGLAIAVAAIVAGAYLAGGSVPQGSVLSPDRRHRVDFYTATRWQWLTRIERLDEPGVAIVVRVSDHRASPSSDVLTLVDSPVLWLPEGVMIGTQAKYVFATERWE